MVSRQRVRMLDLVGAHRELRAELRAAFDRAVDAAAFVGGEEVVRFEAEFAAYTGAHHCVGVGNGTDALTLALRALEVGPGDRVLTTPFTFAAAVEAIDLVGATPVFADIDERDLTLDVDAVAAALERQPVKALIAVHLFGHPADMERLVPLARQHGTRVVEDAAQAHGARVAIDGDWRRTGSIGDVAAFSFYPTKNLGALGDAGAVTTNEEAIAERVRLLRDHGQTEKYVHAIRGATNSRLDALQAAFLRIKLKRLEAMNRARRAAARRYARLLSGLGLRLPRERAGAESAFHLYAARVRERDAVRRRLDELGIETGVHYPRPLHRQPAYRLLDVGPRSFPVAEKTSEEILCLPLFPQIEEEEQERVAEALRAVLSGSGGGA